MKVTKLSSKSILNPTGGFLKGFTHTINPYYGCQLGKSLCGSYCYANAISKELRKEPREWGNYLDIKTNAKDIYQKDFSKLKQNKPNSQINIFMSSVTDPYTPLEKEVKITRDILKAMVEFVPDTLVIQTHTALILRDIDIIEKLIDNSCNVAVQITVETDMENDDIANFYSKFNFAHAYSIKDRLDALNKLKLENIFSVATISPLLPLNDPVNFAKRIEKCTHYVILDHYLLGDGSKGKRTKSKSFFSEPLPDMFERNNLSEWNNLDGFFEIVSKFKDILGEQRVGISKDGFTNVIRKSREFYHHNSNQAD